MLVSDFANRGNRNRGPPDALSVTAVLKRLGLVGLRSVGPSVSVGVGRNELVVRKNCQSSVLNTPHADVDIWTYRYNVVCTLIREPSPPAEIDDKITILP